MSVLTQQPWTCTPEAPTCCCAASASSLAARRASLAARSAARASARWAAPRSASIQAAWEAGGAIRGGWVGGLQGAEGEGQRKCEFVGLWGCCVGVQGTVGCGVVCGRLGWGQGGA
jgi:hypothetical protein